MSLFSDIFKIALDGIKKNRLWKWAEQIVAILALFVAVHVGAYKYIQWRYEISLTPNFYLRCYIFIVVTLVFVSLGLALFILTKPLEKERSRDAGRVRRFLYEHRAILGRRFLCVLLIFAILGLGLSYLLPKKVRNLKIVFLNAPNFDKYAFVYIIYELNKRQKYWYFDINFDDFNERSLHPDERIDSDVPDRNMQYAMLLSKGEPLIAIATDSLGEDFFFQNRGKVSVVSTDTWDRFAPPTVYEFLTFCVIEQSILIHLNEHSKGLPEGAFEESREAFGNLFQFSPKRSAVKAFILASHLSPSDERLLMNSFGVEYLQTCSELLTLNWMKSGSVKWNLKRCYDIDIGEGP